MVLSKGGRGVVGRFFGFFKKNRPLGTNRGLEAEKSTFCEIGQHTFRALGILVLGLGTIFDDLRYPGRYPVSAIALK